MIIGPTIFSRGNCSYVIIENFFDGLRSLHPTNMAKNKIKMHEPVFHAFLQIFFSRVYPIVNYGNMYFKYSPLRILLQLFQHYLNLYVYILPMLQ